MADDKLKAKEDRKLVAGDETYEVADFAKKYGVPPSEANNNQEIWSVSREARHLHAGA